MSKIDELVKEACELPSDQRLTLAHRVLAAAEPPPSAEIEEAWDFAIRERIRKFDQGKSRSRPASEILADLDRRLGS